MRRPTTSTLLTSSTPWRPTSPGTRTEFRHDRLHRAAPSRTCGRPRRRGPEGHAEGGLSMTAATLTRAAGETAGATPVNRKRRRWVFHAVMAPLTLIWVAPMVFVLILAFRPFDD